MATTYKSLSTNDIVTTKTLLHEAIPITGTIVSGTYVNGGNEINIKDYTHAMFQSVYDYPYLSSSANHMFDITVGCHADSNIISASSAARPGLTQGTKKVNVYNQMAQVLMGYDENGNIRKFDRDGNLATTGDKLIEGVFVNFARLLTKDEIKKGTFSLQLGVANDYTNTGVNSSSFSSGSANNMIVKLYDKGAATDYRVNSPAGDYGILYASSSNANVLVNNDTEKVGLIFYQAGVAVFDPGLFHNDNLTGFEAYLSAGYIEGGNNMRDCNMNASGSEEEQEIAGIMISSSIPNIADAIRHRIYNIEFNNTTELNSTVYFCRAHHNEFNYSTNPTYINGSKMVVKNNASDTPLSYITTVGLYSADNELLAVAKVSEPLKKDPTNELTLRVRLDY